MDASTATIEPVTIEPVTIEPVTEVVDPRARLPMSARPLGEILVLTAGLAPGKVDEALAVQREKGGRLGDVLVSLKHATEDQVSRALAAQFELEFRPRIGLEEVDIELVSKLPIAFSKQFKLLPLKRTEDGGVLVAVADPLETAAVDQARLLLSATPELVLTTPTALLEAINAAYDRAAHESQRLVDDLEETEDLADLSHEVEEAQDILEQGVDEAPIIRLVNSLLFRAVKERASDIHVEPYERDMAVRYRVDGVLKHIISPPKRAQNSIISRIKVMGGLNIAEKRLPQDGRIRIKLAGKDIDIRLSTTPTVHGERIVMRLLDKSSVVLDLKDIGFDERQLSLIEQLIARPHGIILVTGPTGSGKTTTLYAAVSRINTPDLNIMTIEDPVEYQLRGVSQTPVNAKINLTFANGLRSFLRQDPDVIMVGEIRDLETAEIAIQASLTGHLVFSTVHTNDAPGSITRLVDMGVQPFLVASSLVAAIAQRLVRVVCKECRVAHRITRDELVNAQIRETMVEEFLARGTFFQASLAGCAKCNFTGYKGRRGIYEIMIVDEVVRPMILRNADSNAIKKEAVAAQGMMLLREDGVRKASMGITTLEEVIRVTEEDVL